MKLLVLLAVLGAAAAQYKLYTGVSPYLSHTAYTYPTAYTAAHPLTYAAHPFPYAAHPYGFYGLPYAFKPAEAEKPAAEEEKPVVVESRSKRSADAEDQKADEALLVSTYASHPYTYPLAYSAPSVYSSGYVYNSGYHPAVYSGYTGLPYAYSGYHAPLVHSLKKRDTAAAEADQQPEDATLYTTYAAHPYTFSAGYPFVRSYAASSVYNTPASTAPLSYAAFPYSYGYRPTYVY